MNGLGRVLATLRGEPADRRAFSLVLSLYGARLTDCAPATYYAKPEAYLAGQQAVAELVDPDILFAPFALPLEARAFGCALKSFDTAPPNVVRPACKGLTGLEALLAPDPTTDPGLRYLVESTRLLSREFGGDKAIAAPITAPTDLPALLVSIGEWIEALLFHPETRDELFRRTHDHFVALAAELFAAGANFLVIPSMFTSPQFLTAKMVGEHIVPALVRAFSRVPGPIVFHHGGNRLAPHLALFKDLPNVLGFALDPRDSFAQARELAGVPPVLLGNLSGPHLPGLSPQQAHARTSDILSRTDRDPRYLFCTSNADIPWSTTPETITAVAQAVREKGGART